MSLAGDLLIRILGQSEGAQNAINEVKGGLKGLLSPANLAKSALRGIGAAASAGLAMGVKSTNELNQVMSQFSAQTGVVGEEADKVRAKVQELYKVNEDGYSDLAGTIAELMTQFKASADVAGEVTQAYLDYAKVTGQDDVQATKAIAEVSKAWNLSIEDSVSLMDKLKAVQQETGADLNQLQQYLKRSAGAMQSLGMSLDEGIAMFGAFAKAGIEPQQAMTAFNTALTKVKSPKELKDLIKDIEATKDPTEAAAKAQELFGVRAGPELARAIQTGKLNIDELMRTIQNSEGVVAQASATYDDNFNVKFALFRKRISGTVQELTDRFGPAITTTSSLAMGMGSLFPNLGATVAGAFSTMGQAAKGFFGLLMANPIILIITAIIGAVILLYKAWTGNWFGIRDKTKAAIEFLVNLFNSLKQKVGEISWEGIKNTAAKAWQGIKDFLGGIWEAIKYATFGDAADLQEGLWNIWVNIQEAVERVWNGIKRFLRETWENLVRSIVQKARSLKDDIIARLEEVWSYIKAIPAKAYNWGRDIINGLWSGVKNVFGNLKNWFQDNVVGLLNRLNPFARHSPSLVEQVKAGVAEINRLYKGLDLSPVLSVTRPVQQPAMATAGGPVYLYGPLVRVEKMEVRSKEDVDAVSEALWSKAEQALRGEGLIRR